MSLPGSDGFFVFVFVCFLFFFEDCQKVHADFCVAAQIFMLTFIFVWPSAKLLPNV